MNYIEPEEREREYQEYRRLGQKLKIPTFEAFLEMEIKMPDGKIVHSHRQRSHSWVRNAYNVFFCQAAQKNADNATFGAGLLSVKDLNGVVWGRENPMGNTTDADGIVGGYRAAAGVSDRGIVVGSGSNAESFEDCALQTLINNGTGAGQLSYILSEAHVINYTPATKVLQNSLIRYFNNNSGGPVTVNEVGLILYPILVGVTWGMVSRDKLLSTVTVPDTGQLKVTYTIQLVYPA